jgi:hypothetical protein
MPDIDVLIRKWLEGNGPWVMALIPISMGIVKNIVTAARKTWPAWYWLDGNPLKYTVFVIALVTVIVEAALANVFRDGVDVKEALVLLLATVSVWLGASGWQEMRVNQGAPSPNLRKDE